MDNRQDRLTLREIYEEILYSTKFSPSYFIHTTYHVNTRPSRFSEAHDKNIEKTIQAISYSLGEHILPYVGVGRNSHSHLILCTLDGYQANEADRLKIKSKWGDGITSVKIYDRGRVGGGAYVLEKHAIMDTAFNKVFCPRIHVSCKRSKKGCPFKWKVGYLNRQTSQRDRYVK